MASSTLYGFGARLATLRQSRSLTQTELGDAAGVSQRVIAYCETESTRLRARCSSISRARCTSRRMRCSASSRSRMHSPKTARLLKRLQRIEELPPADQRAVLKLVDAMLDTRRRATPPRVKKRKVS